MPICDRLIHIVRTDPDRLHNWRTSVTSQAKTIGEHLRNRRLELSLKQQEAAQQLGISARTLSLWETDRTYPSWDHQAGVKAYLGHDPFTNPALGRPLGNETQAVANSSPTTLKTTMNMGEQMRLRRLELRKNRSVCAKELGVSDKTLWGWETGHHAPSSAAAKRLEMVLGIAVQRADG